jgi:hypothetical protein
MLRYKNQSLKRGRRSTGKKRELTGKALTKRREKTVDRRRKEITRERVAVRTNDRGVAANLNTIVRRKIKIRRGDNVQTSVPMKKTIENIALDLFI